MTYNTLPTHTVASGLPFNFPSLLVLVLMFIASWKIYVKAGKPGWACLIPIYSTIVLFRIVGMPGWNILLVFVPIVNIYIAIKLTIKLAHSFGRSTLFGIGLLLIPVIFYPILGFGKSQYILNQPTQPTTPVAPPTTSDPTPPTP